jgi:hypothetical protein
MNLEQVVDKFVKHPSLITNGAPTLANRWSVDVDLVYEARAIAKDILKNKEEFGTEYHPEDVSFKNSEEILQEKLFNFGNAIVKEKGKLLKKWGSEGNWKYSYSFEEDSAETSIDFEKIISKVLKDVKPVDIEDFKIEIKNGGKTLHLYFADQHIGASVEHSLYSNYFDRDVYKNRMNKVFIWVAKQVAALGIFEKIVVFFLGDTFDGQDGYTVKRSHELPQNMSNEEAFEVGLYTNKVFLERLFKAGFANSYDVRFVRESNHGGSMDYFLFKSLDMWIKAVYPQVESKIAHKFIDHVEFDNRTFIYTHGKDNKDMKNGLPLNLDPKTEIFINQ